MMCIEKHGLGNGNAAFLHGLGNGNAIEKQLNNSALATGTLYTALATGTPPACANGAPVSLSSFLAQHSGPQGMLANAICDDDANRGTSG